MAVLSTAFTFCWYCVLQNQFSGETVFNHRLVKVKKNVKD